jgi:hypothetical protein
VKIMSCSTSKRRIEIKELSEIQRIALYSLAGNLGLDILKQWDASVGGAVILEVSTTKQDYSKMFDELTSLFATMRNLSLGGWHDVEQNSGT